jgi:hypothetical protein
MEVTTALALRLLLLLTALVACNCLACARYRPAWRRIGGLASLAIVLVIVGRTGLVLIPSSEYQITTVQGQERTSVTVRFNQPEHPSLVRFGEPRQLWNPPQYPPEFVIANSRDGTNFREFRSPVRPLLPIFGVEESRVLRISESQKTSGLWLGQVEVFRSEIPWLWLLPGGILSYVAAVFLARFAAVG